MRTHEYGTRSVVRSSMTDEPIGYIVHEGPHRFSAYSNAAGTLGDFTMSRKAVDAILTAHETMLAEVDAEIHDEF